MSSEHHSENSSTGLQGECPICHEALEDIELRITDCNHKFHAKCFEQWKHFNHDEGTRVTSCPFCRQPLLLSLIQRIPIPSNHAHKENRVYIQGPHGWIAWADTTNGVDLSYGVDGGDDDFYLQTPDGRTGRARLWPLADFTVVNVQEMLDMLAILPARFEFWERLILQGHNPEEETLTWRTRYQFMDQEENLNEEIVKKVMWIVKDSDLQDLRWIGQKENDPCWTGVIERTF